MKLTLRALARSTLLFILLANCAVASHAQQRPSAPDYDAQEWREFVSPEAGFSVLLPGRPDEKVEEHNSPDGTFTTRTFTLRNEEDAPQYDMMLVELPVAPPAENLALVFNTVRDNGLRAVRGTLLEERQLSDAVYAGRFYRIRTGDGQLMRVKALVIKNRFYNLICTSASRRRTGAKMRLDDEAAARFFDSFRLLTEQELAQFEGEVDKLLKSLRQKGEVIYGVCSDDARCKPAGNRLESEGVISKPPPVYPPIAKAARAQGTVTVQVLVDEEGKVMAAQIVSGHPLLQRAAIAAARQAVFKPFRLRNAPVKMVGVISYDFVLK